MKNDDERPLIHSDYPVRGIYAFLALRTEHLFAFFLTKIFSGGPVMSHSEQAMSDADGGGRKYVSEPEESG